MSTYGTVVIADVVDEAAAAVVEKQFRSVLGRRYQNPGGSSLPMSNPLDDTEIDVDPGDSSVRVSLLVERVVVGDLAGDVFAGVGAGRAVLCEDGDEWGVTVSGWRLSTGVAECVYRAYVPADAEDVDEDASSRVVAGPGPAGALAELFGVDGEPVRELDADPTTIRDGIGYIADPFLPWLHNLELDWPEF